MGKRSQQIEMHFRRGRQLHAVGRLAEAAQIYKQILAVAPEHGDAAHGLGVLALQMHQPRVAIDYFDRAIAYRPSTAVFHAHRANALLALGSFDDAVAACLTALRYKRKFPEAFQTLGHALSDSGHRDEALTAYRDAIRQNPSLPDIQNNLGTALRNLQRLEEAEAQFREAIRLAPGDPGGFANLSNVLKEQGRIEEAETQLRKALRLNPSDPVLQYNLGLLLLLTGHFGDGWAGFEYRFAANAVPARALGQRQWFGEPLRDRKLLIHAEQGLGDAIQFCRFAQQVSGSVALEVPRRMVRLMSRLPNAPALIAAGDELPAVDLVCPMMSFPGRMGTSIEGLRSAVPYLSGEPELVARWKSKLGNDGFKVGIAWQGNPNRHEDLGRSVDLSHFRPLAQVSGVRLISLQRHAGLEQLGSLPEVEDYGIELDDGPDAFVDTAAMLESLDLVISTDTAVAHLAGAMARPVWVALRMVPDWRWMLNRNDSPWYPTMQLVRQIERGKWEQVFAEITQRLEFLVRR